MFLSSLLGIQFVPSFWVGGGGEGVGLVPSRLNSFAQWGFFRQITPATKIPFMCSFSGNCAASVPTSIFICL
jgi:hypothetical protein